MTLAELLAVSTILLMMAGTMGALAISVQEGSVYNAEQGLALQHGQVTIQRIQRALTSATGNATFPGFHVISETAGGQSYPDVLVIWKPRSGAANPDGSPRMNELVVYCANPNSPNELWEITAPNDIRNAPAISNSSAWRTELNYLRTDSSVQRVVLTDKVRVAIPTDGSGNSLTRRAAIRFHVVVRPSETEWTQLLAGTRKWEDMSWVQGIHGTQSGLRQSWCRFEIQLRPGDSVDDSREVAIPFFGSGAVMYELQKP